MLPGSIATVFIRCGKKNCLCHKDPKHRHGPYYQWSGVINGKRTSKLIPPELLKECQEGIKNYQKLTAKLEELKASAIRNAPWSRKPF